MQLRIFEQTSVNGQVLSLLDELLTMAKSANFDAKLAAVDFHRALKTMALKGHLLAEPVPKHHWQSMFTLSESLWSRVTWKHSLYISRTNKPSQTQGAEVRALLACNESVPTMASIGQAAARHRRM